VKRLLLTLALTGVALAAAACGSTNAGEPGSPAVASPAAPADPNAPVITARDLTFGQAEVVVPAGVDFQLTFDNQESAPHNVAIYTDSSASTMLFRGEIFSSASKTETVPALAAGSYFFRCDVHPEMTGTIVAK
jgi:plastocyanin